MTGERLTRDLQHAMIGGVCAGFARRYDFDVTLVRVVMVLATLATAGLGVPVYIAAWIVMPRAGEAPLSSGAPLDSPERVADEIRRVSDRVAEAARVLAGKTREAAEEISEIARRGPAAGAATAAPPAPAAPAAPPEGTPPAPPAS